MTGWRVGLPWLWPEASHWEPMATPAFPVRPNHVNAGKQQDRLLLRRSSCSPSGVLSVAAFSQFLSIKLRNVGYNSRSITHVLASFTCTSTAARTNGPSNIRGTINP
jgi:hypothetical protein